MTLYFKNNGIKYSGDLEIVETDDKYDQKILCKIKKYLQINDIINIDKIIKLLKKAYPLHSSILIHTAVIKGRKKDSATICLINADKLIDICEAIDKTENSYMLL